MNNENNLYSLINGCSSLISLPDLSNWKFTSLVDENKLMETCFSIINLPNISQSNFDNYYDGDNDYENNFDFFDRNNYYYNNNFYNRKRKHKKEFDFPYQIWDFRKYDN